MSGTTLTFTAVIQGAPAALGDIGADAWRVQSSAPVSQICVTYESSTPTISAFDPYNKEEWYHIYACAKVKTLCNATAMTASLTCTTPGILQNMTPNTLQNGNTLLTSDINSEIPNGTGAATAAVYGPFNYLAYKDANCNPIAALIEYKDDAGATQPFKLGNNVEAGYVTVSTLQGSLPTFLPALTRYLFKYKKRQPAFKRRRQP